MVYVSPLKALSNDIRQISTSRSAGIRPALRSRLCGDVAISARGCAPAIRRQSSASHAQAATARPRHDARIACICLLDQRFGPPPCCRPPEAVIVDEIHALARDKRGAIWRYPSSGSRALRRSPLQRIGLSATQKPIEEVARFLVGAGGAGERAPVIIDSGHRRARDLALEVPDSPLEAVMSAEVWDRVYRRVADLVAEHRTTLIFVNTRRMAERTTRKLSDLLGEEHVAAHHGSLAKEQRLDAEQRLKHGQLKALVATASLELGIDIGDVDLVCQLGSPRSITSFLQRVGRSGHAVEGTPKGRLFPLSRDQLVECAAPLDSVRRGELDRLAIPEQPLDVLAQQTVAEVAAREYGEDELYALVRRAWPYRNLAREDFAAIVEMLADGFSTRRGRRGALIHHDGVNRLLRGRRGARG